MRKLRDSIERKPSALIVTCSVQQVPICFESDGEYEFDGKTVAAVEREMIDAGWLDDFIIEGEIHLICPACVEYCRENVASFEKLDTRVGGNAATKR